MKYAGIRINGNIVETSVNTFERPDTGSVIGYVSLIHGALPGYYEQIGELLEENEKTGAVIDFEYIHQPTEEDRQREPEMTELCDRLYRAGQAFTRPMEQAFGLVRQRETLPPHETWQLNDPTALETVKTLGVVATEKLITAHESRARRHSSMSREQLRKAFLRQNSSFTQRLARTVPSPFRQVLLTDRNNLRLQNVDALLERDPGQNITFAMGFGHLYGIGKGLEQRGYQLRPKKTEWRPAFSLE